MPNVVTIREAIQRSRADGIPISEYTLRQWVRTGEIPVRKVGQKALIFYPNLVAYLQCADNGGSLSTAPAASPGIRRVDVG